MVIQVIHQNILLLGLSQWGYTLRDIEYFGGVVIFTGEQFERHQRIQYRLCGVGVWKMMTYIGDVLEKVITNKRTYTRNKTKNGFSH